MQKISKIDENLVLAFSGMHADGRVLTNLARRIAQYCRNISDEPATANFVSGHISNIQQEFTQRGGARPFGVSLMIGGLDLDHTAHLYITDPTGSHSEWIAGSIGQHGDIVQTWLEKNYTEKKTRENAIKAAIKAMSDVSQGGAKSLEIVVLDQNGIHKLTSAEILAAVE